MKKKRKDIVPFRKILKLISALLLHLAGYSYALSAPPYPGIWKRTKIGFKSEKDHMEVAPEILLTPKLQTKLKSKGDVRCVVLLAEFQDKRLKVEIDQKEYNPPLYFKELMFGSYKSNLYYKFPSFREYWEINSNGNLKINGELFGPYTLPSTLSEYACGSKNGDIRYCGLGRGTNTLVRELVSLADADVDFSKYDENNDGTVDCFIIIHAGKGGEVQEYSVSSPKCCDIWSHAFSTYAQTADGVLIKDGIIAAGISELFPYGNMGLIAHEFGHLLGLVDLYDTGTSGHVSCGVGPYSLMGYGLYKGIGKARGTLPSSLSPWEKIYLEWADPVLIYGQYCDKISSTSYSSSFLKIPAYSDVHSKEYFLLEFRKRELFDSDFPVDGVLIWHIDEEVIRHKFGSNSINTDECFPKCDKACGELKDNKGNFITCQKHYGIRILPRWGKSNPWFFEMTDINEESYKCLMADAQDFWVKGTIFPDSYTSSFGYKGIEHKVLIAVYSDELNNINIAATSDSSKIVLRGPSIKNSDVYNWVSPGGDYIAKIWIEGTAPILLRMIYPPDAYIKIEDKLYSEVQIFSRGGYVNQEIEVFWKAPEHEMSQSITLLAENCVQKVLEQWATLVQKPKTTLDSIPVDPDGSSVVMGCTCRATRVSNAHSHLATLILAIIALVLFFRSKKSP